MNKHQLCLCMVHVTPFHSKSSGAMNRSVPILLVCEMSRLSSFASPKSLIRTCLLLLRRMLDGLRSRCIKSFDRIKCIPRTNSTTIRFFSSWVRLCSWMAFSSEVGSRVRYMEGGCDEFPWSKPNISTIHGCRNWSKTSHSCKKRWSGS